MKNSNEKLTILYARRSRNDPKDSLETQQRTLEEYAVCNGFDNTIFLSDDGHNGIGFDRPGFMQLLILAKLGHAERIIVTDLSRFGRDITQIQEYTDKVFPSCGVNFIALDMLDEDEFEVEYS